jgi:hypothetical protein
LRRFILNAEREHGGDLSHRTIAVIILTKMGWIEEPELLAKIEEKVRYARKDLRRKA